MALLELIKLLRALAWFAGMFFMFLLFSSLGSLFGGVLGMKSPNQDVAAGPSGVLAADPDSASLLYDTEELPKDCGDIYYDEARHEPMDSKYTLDPNDPDSQCFVDQGYVSQGPFGQTTHAYCCPPEIANKRKGFLNECRRCRLGCEGSCDGCPVTDQYAIDINNVGKSNEKGIADLEIHAPVDGKIISCELEIVHFKDIGDKKNGEVLVLQDLKTGHLFYFVHTVCSPRVAALGGIGTYVKRGTVIARTATFKDIPVYVEESPYWGAAHVHFFVLAPNGKYIYTGDWFKKKCGAIVTLPEYVNKQFDKSFCNKLGGGCVDY